MAFVAGWVVVLLSLAMWSGLVWSGHALLAALLSQTGTLGSGGWSLPASLTAWLPASVAQWLSQALETLVPQLQALAGSLSGLSGGVTVLAWVVWGAGVLLLSGLGLALHVAIALWRKSKRPVLPQPVALLR